MFFMFENVVLESRCYLDFSGFHFHVNGFDLIYYITILLWDKFLAIPIEI